MDTSIFYKTPGYFVGERRGYTKMSCLRCRMRVIIMHNLAPVDLEAQMQALKDHASTHDQQLDTK
jgi:hypothetical protein